MLGTALKGVQFYLEDPNLRHLDLRSVFKTFKGFYGLSSKFLKKLEFSNAVCHHLLSLCAPPSCALPSSSGLMCR